MQSNIITAIALFLCTAIAAPVMAQDYDKGLAAAQAGDFVTAIEEWRPLAEQGIAAAQHNLGRMYDNGDGVPRDYAEAVKWYRLAAEQRYALSQTHLGSMYMFGKGVIQDDVIAHMWLNIGGANGNVLGSKGRGIIEGHMTLEQIAEAQALARRCMSSIYQDCG